jgi:hypothetical protein
MAGEDTADWEDLVHAEVKWMWTSDNAVVTCSYNL